MRRRNPMLAVILVAVALLMSGSGASARSYVNPTTLTPPLKPFRVCWQLGPYVQCDTSGVVSYENLPTDVAPCGLNLRDGNRGQQLDALVSGRVARPTRRRGERQGDMEPVPDGRRTDGHLRQERELG